ncbi:hypothetical protein NEIMUCOT_04093 [Neisseria mucosa ATCC 25996]|uniref:Uncharacterized protein n=1 Tax=Neisseria mucosa (strain ATCC 25996 / DSM 4631 / NCTC 10774 / M26) TaxID=546266 RepID=D2ZU06_NEIM2|nr:hypothetical protein NEIMUCOT_04093 [Neisseria mucosa ATCC 25996]
MRDTIVKLPTLAKAPNKFIRFIPSKVQTSSESAYCTTELNRTLFSDDLFQHRLKPSFPYMKLSFSHQTIYQTAKMQ